MELWHKGLGDSFALAYSFVMPRHLIVKLGCKPPIMFGRSTPVLLINLWVMICPHTLFFLQVLFLCLFLRGHCEMVIGSEW